MGHIGLYDELVLLFQNEKIVCWLMETFNSIFREKEYEYADNRRFADTANQQHLEIYNKKRKTGCCGFYDEKFLCPINNKEYAIGFNFGH